MKRKIISVVSIIIAAAAVRYLACGPSDPSSVALGIIEGWCSVYIVYVIMRDREVPRG